MNWILLQDQKHDLRAFINTQKLRNFPFPENFYSHVNFFDLSSYLIPDCAINP